MLGWFEGGDGLGLAVEAGQGGGVVGLVGRQHLERDLPPQLEVFAEVDRPHAAGADAVEDEVLADEEFRPPAAHQVVGLERREEAVADQEGGQVARPARQSGGPAQVGDVAAQPRRVQRQALLNQFEQIGGGGWRSHCDHLASRVASCPGVGEPGRVMPGVRLQFAIGGRRMQAGPARKSRRETDLTNRLLEPIGPIRSLTLPSVPTRKDTQECDRSRV